MRIIAGEFRGRKLLGPADKATRPITDRVKQSIFDLLTPRFGEAVVYDVFAGTGSFGLESLSRGATHCVFFERHRPAIERLRRNLDTLGVGDRATLVKQDVFRIDLDALPPADIVFFDPPYPLLTSTPQAIGELLGRLMARLNVDGVTSFRHPIPLGLDLPKKQVLAERRYGSMAVTLLEKA
jgi:16S rRNA (guanine966-N2)-methyltransferase